MMQDNNNFLLKIHMEEDNNIIEIYINKEHRLFYFLNEECISDFVVPESKIKQIGLIMDENNYDKGKNDVCYAQYRYDNTSLDLYDKGQVGKLFDLVTKISINDFLDNKSDIKLNNYFVDEIIDKYDCTLPIEVKKIFSYTVNGIDFEDGKHKMLSHDKIINLYGLIENFIPFMIKENDNYIGYDYKSETYKEYLEMKQIGEADTLKELMELDHSNQNDDLEIVSSESSGEEETTDNIEDRLYDDYSAINDGKLQQIIRNIDLQLEKLNAGIDDEKIDDSKYAASDVILPEKNEDEAISFLENLKDKSDEKIEDETLNCEPINDAPFVEDTVAADEKIDEENKLIEQEILDNVKEALAKMTYVEEKPESNESTKNLELETEKENETKDKTEDGPPFDTTKFASALINNCIVEGLNNYQINFNDTQKLVIEHLPYYEISSSFEVIQIPEIELSKVTLLPDGDIDLGEIKLCVEKLKDDEVQFVVKSNNSVVDKKGNKLKKGSHITLNFNDELSLRLDKKGAMETWSLKVESSIFEKELRNIDYGKIMKIITNLDSYKKLGGIEKYELEKSVMLFINFVMIYKEEDKLTELYRILADEPDMFEEYVSLCNIDHSLEMRDSLPTYEQKKDYVMKLNYVNGLANNKWLDYPRYIFSSHQYFDSDQFLKEFNFELNSTLKDEDFSNYIYSLFNEYGMFNDLDTEGKENLDKCLNYLSILYKHNPELGENNKYRIEREFMIGADEEDMSLLISKICRKSIKDYSNFVDYDSMIKQKYRLGELKYPIYSEYFEIDGIRNGGDDYEY